LNRILPFQSIFSGPRLLSRPITHSARLVS
jgi:hypothetical protein